MKSSEFRALTLLELNEKLDQMIKNLYQLRVKAVTKELENTAQIKAERRNIARAKQIIADKKQEAGASKAA